MSWAKKKTFNAIFSLDSTNSNRQHSSNSNGYNIYNKIRDRRRKKIVYVIAINWKWKKKSIEWENWENSRFFSRRNWAYNVKVLNNSLVVTIKTFLFSTNLLPLSFYAHDLSLFSWHNIYTSTCGYTLFMKLLCDIFQGILSISLILAYSLCLPARYYYFILESMLHVVVVYTLL